MKFESPSYKKKNSTTVHSGCALTKNVGNMQMSKVVIDLFGTKFCILFYVVVQKVIDYTLWMHVRSKVISIFDENKICIETTHL